MAQQIKARDTISASKLIACIKWKRIRVRYLY